MTVMVTRATAMVTRATRATAAMVVTALLTLLTSATPALATPPPAGTAPPPAEPPKTDVPPAPGDTHPTTNGFVLEQKKWWRADRAKNIALRAAYIWGGKGERQSQGIDAGDRWVLRFEDRPAQGDVVVVVLTYTFELTDADRKAIRDRIEHASTAVTDVIAEAHREAKGDSSAYEKALTEKSQKLIDATEDIAVYRTKSGKSGRDFLLESLGFKKEGDAGWRPDPVSVINGAFDRRGFYQNLEQELDLLQQNARDYATAAPETTAENRATPAERKACLDEVGSATRSAAGRAFVALKACAEWSSAAWGTPALKAAVNALPNAEAVPPASRPRGALAGLAPSNAKSHRAFQMVLSRVNVAVVEVEYQRRVVDPLATLFVSKEVSLRKEELASVLLEQGGERRSYEASTGVVYASGLDDMIVPILFSYCPVGGCLRRGEPFWSSKAALGHSFTLDLGVKASTLDEENPRQKGKVGLLVGASWNPFFFVRFGGGLYHFENAERPGRWNTSPYFGLTFDVLHAAELFGLTGLGMPDAPKARSSESP
jgi:hypothetical protein